MSLKSTLSMAAWEIRSLRKQNEILRAKEEVMNIFAAALGFQRSGGAMAPDVVTELEAAIDNLPKEPQE